MSLHSDDDFILRPSSPWRQDALNLRVCVGPSLVCEKSRFFEKSVSGNWAPFMVFLYYGLSVLPRAERILRVPLLRPVPPGRQGVLIFQA